MFSPGNPAARVLILPGNGQPGMLETLLCKIFEGSRANQCIDDFFQCVPPEAPETRLPKARVRAWISLKEDPSVSAGVAAQKKFWNLDHQALEPIRNLLTALRQ